MLVPREQLVNTLCSNLFMCGWMCDDAAGSSNTDTFDNICSTFRKQIRCDGIVDLQSLNASRLKTTSLSGVSQRFRFALHCIV